MMPKDYCTISVLVSITSPVADTRCTLYCPAVRFWRFRVVDVCGAVNDVEDNTIPLVLAICTVPLCTWFVML